MKIYLAGCGKIGTRLGQALIHRHQVIGLKRNKANLGFPVLPIDLASQINLPADADIIVFTVTPSQYDVIGYKTVYDTILNNVIVWANRHSTPPLILLVSSTGVYGQHNGEVVDENSTTAPTRPTSKWILYGETQLREKSQNTLTLRFSGIYGNGRDRLIRKVRSLHETNEAIQQTPAVWTNRIHEDDCVGVLNFLIDQYSLGARLDKIYLASDDSPVSQYNVLAYISSQLQLPTPRIKIDNLTDQLNKRCINTRLKKLGYTFKYPSYKDGYRDQ